MRIGSLFSGGGGGDLGFQTAGHEIVFGCEIDPKARSVFRYHHPNIPIYTDVREVTRERLESDGIALPELIMGGSPCQDLSLAGNRAGLGGERSGLFHEQCRIATELASPWVCWENVAGAFSSNKGADFAAVLGGLTGNTPAVPNGGWKTGGVCVGPDRVAVWRVLDAQNFGVPQRRRRVFVVAGPRALARRVVEVLFESESSDRDTPPSRKTWENLAAETAGRVATNNTGCGGPRTIDIDGGTRVVNGLPQQEPFAAFDSTWSGHYDINNDGAISPTLKVGGTTGGNPPAIATEPLCIAENQRNEIRTSPISFALNTGGGKPGQGHATAQIGSIVRRLTPLECERLMGWPNNYTLTGTDDNGNPVEIATTNRYRICGNGIVANVTQWIGERLL